jgi:hypothetical protein
MIRRQVQKWAYGLVGGCIGGGAGSLSAWLGLTVAKAVGIDVPVLNWKAMGVIFLTGAVTHAVAYLAKSPLPPLDDTQPPFPNEDGSNVKDI